jgi:hypothetical protein
MKVKLTVCLLLMTLMGFIPAPPNNDGWKELIKVLRKQILKQAAWAMRQQTVTVTAQSCARSAGGGWNSKDLRPIS